MKFFVPFVAAVAVVQAATPVNRQASPSAAVRAAIQAIVDDSAALQSAVEGLNSIDQVVGVQTAITQLQNTINSGAQQFTTLSPLSDPDTLALADLVAPLQDGTDAAVQAVIAKKDVIVGLCVGPVAYSTFQDLIPAAQAFADNLAALVSTTYKGIINSASDSIQGSLNEGLNAFQDAQTAPDNCSPTTPPDGGEGTTTAPPPGTTTLPPSCYRRRHKRHAVAA